MGPDSVKDSNYSSGIRPGVLQHEVLFSPFHSVGNAEFSLHTEPPLSITQDSFEAQPIPEGMSGVIVIETTVRLDLIVPIHEFLH